MAGATVAQLFGYLWLAFGGSHVLRVAAEITAAGRRGCRIMRVSADLPAREHDVRPVGVVTVK